MPANLPPEYFAADKRFRAAKTTEDKVTYLQELYGTIPKHKGTDKLRADVRRRLAKLKEESQTHKSAVGRHESAYHIEREGSGQAALIGMPNTGKSSLLAAMTHARPEIAGYPFTTWTPMPGMMPIGDIQVQLIDTPPFSREHVEPALLDLIRRTDLLLIVVDIVESPAMQIEETISILLEHRIVPIPVRERATDLSRSVFLPALVVANKNDDENTDKDAQRLRERLDGSWNMCFASALKGRNLDRIKQCVFDALGIIRVYSKPPGKKAERNSPFVLKKGSTVADLAANVHHDFMEKLTVARVWGSGLYDGQPVGRDHVLRDGDMVELRI